MRLFPRKKDKQPMPPPAGDRVMPPAGDETPPPAWEGEDSAVPQDAEGVSDRQSPAESQWHGGSETDGQVDAALAKRLPPGKRTAKAKPKASKARKPAAKKARASKAKKSPKSKKTARRKR